VASLGQTVHETPISKVSRAKWMRGMAEAVECLLCNHKDMSSILLLPKKEKERKFLN
jgi:hypothetical protein